MKEKKKIFWIIGLSLILLTICIIGIIVIKNIYMKDKYIDEDGKATTIDTPQGDVYEEAKYSKEKVANSTYFYSIEKCINNYLNAIKIGGAVDVIDLLDSDFIKTNNLNTNNILTNIESAYTFLATEIYETRDKTLYSYIVKGTEDDGKYEVRRRRKRRRVRHTAAENFRQRAHTRRRFAGDARPRCRAGGHQGNLPRGQGRSDPLAA